ncbi:MAG: hypothetical protein RMN52_02205 [Anaerolineae bacterium]|nr:redoxin domain-containing protein [Candidatus Roseilinea sp.]MDW8448793.1 hypothetical protein [Anaerolineae bacterium]
MEGIWLIAFLAQWALLLLLGLLVIGTLRQLGIMQQRWRMAAPPITSLEIGDVLPDLYLPDQDSEIVPVSGHLKQRGGVILFLSGACAACRMVLEQLEALEDSDVANRGVVLIMVGDVAEARRLLRSHPGLAPAILVVFDVEGTAMRRLNVIAVPTGLVVDERCRLVSQTFNPHAGQWIYKALRIAPPIQREAHAEVGLIVPAVYVASSKLHSAPEGGDRM